MSNPTLQFTLGDKLVKVRRFHGLTQTEAAARLGIGKRSLVRYENDEALPDLETLREYRRVFGISLAWLLDDEEGGSVTSSVTLRKPDQLDMFDLLTADFDWHPCLEAA